MLRLLPKVRNIAHRGASAEAPENTLAAFRRALAIGVDFIEMDLHRTRDGALVVIHDERVDRTTNSQGFVRDLKLADVRGLDVGSWFLRPDGAPGPPPFAGERVPTLQEVIDWARPTSVGLYLEIKYGPEDPPGMEAALVAALARNRFDARVIIECFDHTVLATVKRLNQALRTCALFETATADPWWAARAVGAQEVAPLWTLATPEWIAAAHRDNLPVVVWTVDAEADLRAMIARGVDGIFTNNPSSLKQILDNV